MNDDLQSQQATKFTTLDQVEKDHIMYVLGAVNGNKAEAAKHLGVSVKTLYNKLERYGVHVKNAEKKEHA